MSHPPVVLGLDFGGTKIAAAVCDPAGNKLASAVVSSRAELGAAASFAHGIATAKELLHATADGSQLVAVGAATFGIPFEDRVELAPAIRGWEALAFGRELAAAFPGARVAAATDAKAAARAEVRWGSLAGYDPAVYLNLGTGLAAAVVTGGQVVTGRHGAAGEIGYSLREHADVGLPAGWRMMLEDMVSGLALARRAAKLGRRLHRGGGLRRQRDRSRAGRHGHGVRPGARVSPGQSHHRRRPGPDRGRRRHGQLLAPDRTGASGGASPGGPLSA